MSLITSIFTMIIVAFSMWFATAASVTLWLRILRIFLDTETILNDMRLELPWFAKQFFEFSEILRASPGSS